MGNTNSKDTLTAQDKAIFQLKKQRDALKQYQKKIYLVIDKQTDAAKEALRDGKPEKAKLYLKLKKQQQTVVNSTYEQLANLEQLIGTIEFKLIEKDVVNGLSEGNKVLKMLNSEMSIEKIDKVMEDIEEEVVRVDEISELLGGRLSDLQELELDDELQALENEVSGKVPIEKVPTMPQVPNTEPVDDKLPLVPNTQPVVENTPRRAEAHEPLAA
ncbi:hypothetical protein PUMCH_001704 [Australozyma saopauloensis]|uniref:Charged multivesicular body protein 6 n=1 Tax=Australozyma saopauloensis TaxID=291208 RepID=A0AAX4H792_9ASCO|nr:hypothetical protein PUMCH_001704 [[Candida] saopauloensis]